MDQLILTDIIQDLDWWILITLCFAGAFFITYISIPSIVSVSKKLDLFEKTKSRGSHSGAIPTLGGIAIFAGIVITGAVFFPHVIMDRYRYVLAALIVLFFTGAKDDLVYINPRNKLLAQIVVAIIVTVLGDFRITSFQGFLGIYDIPYVISIVFSIFVYIVIINGFNLIDGIDGLASGVAILVSVAFGILFILDDQVIHAYEPVVLAGSLLAFFIFNVFSKKNKIFLGDTGSLTVGFIVSVIAISFLECDHMENTSRIVKSVPAMTFGILIVPLFDTLRVFTIRMFEGKSPFSADRKHIHHRLLDMGFSHLKATLIILAANMVIIGTVFLFQNLRGSLLVIILLFLSAGLSYIPVYLVDRKRNGSKSV
ncbi:MraY family glycosyltransferase [Bacteroidota bacterium]